MGIPAEPLSEFGYVVLEEASNKAADTLGIGPIELDVAVWNVSGN